MLQKTTLNLNQGLRVVSRKYLMREDVSLTNLL